MNSIPQELKELKQWVLWKREEDGTKHPYQIDGFKAKTSAPRTWASFTDVIRRFQNSGKKFKGIGFVFTADDVYCGIDLDHSVNDGVVSESALKIVRDMSSYTEISPSGTGLHIIVGATIRGHRRRTQGIEMYDSAQFFTMTGNRLEGTSAIINIRQKELDKLYAQAFGTPSSSVIASKPKLQSVPLMDAEVMLLCEQAKNGAKFRALFNGDVSSVNGDYSAGDIALCSMFAFYTQDSAQINRLFQSSELYKIPARTDSNGKKKIARCRKWDGKYGVETIEKAIDRCGNYYKGTGWK
jgi:putative DNA primase/helicase